MTEWFARIFAGRSWAEIGRDIVDVLVVAYVIYRALLVVRGTRAMQMGVGLGVIFLLYLAAKVLNLVTLLSLLSYLLSSIILIVVVVFQNDIRRALIRVGGQAWLGRGRKQEQSRVIDEVVASVTELARHRIGAIIAFEQDANLLEFTKSEGTVIGAAVTRELLVALFYPESVNKLHDGAVIIRDLKIARGGVFFPMPDTKLLDKSLGSRHRAALGITEETDAVVVVVSEERGTISFCFNGNIVPNLDGTALRQTLVGILEQKGKKTPAPRLATTKPSSEGRSSLNPTPRHSIEMPSGKARESALATPLPGHPIQGFSLTPTPSPRTRFARSSTTAPLRAEIERVSDPPVPHPHAASDLRGRSSTMPLVSSKPMPRASSLPLTRDERDSLDVDRPSTPPSAPPPSASPPSAPPPSASPSSASPSSASPSSASPSSASPSSASPSSGPPSSGPPPSAPPPSADGDGHRNASPPEIDDDSASPPPAQADGPVESDRPSFVPRMNAPPPEDSEPSRGSNEP